MYKEQVIACVRNALREMEDGRTAYLNEKSNTPVSGVMDCVFDGLGYTDMDCCSGMRIGTLGRWIWRCRKYGIIFS